MKNAACIILLVSLLVATAAPAAPAQEQPDNQTIEVVGTGRIRGEDISGARDQAISDSLVTAISQVAADLLQQQVFIQSFQDVNRLLFTGADNFIQDYKVLTEDTTGRVYRVMVQTTVSVAKIRTILIQNNILAQNAGPLRVLLLIAEQDLDDLFYRYWWGNAKFKTISEAPLGGALFGQGFIVIDHSPSWSAGDNFDTLMETPLGSEVGSFRTGISFDRENAASDYDRSWPASNESGTLVETPLSPEADNFQSDTSLDGEEDASDYGRSWSASNDSGTLMEAPPEFEMDNAPDAASFERKAETLDYSGQWPAAREYDSFFDDRPGPEMSNSQAVTLGARFRADVVVVGTATVKKASNVLGDELRSFEGALSVRALRADTGDVLAEIDHKFITADADDLAGSHRALTEASAQTGELLAWKIQTAWQQTLQTGPAAAKIVVEGGFQLPHLVAFRRILSSMTGVSNLQTTEMTPEETILSLEYDGTTKELAEALLLNAFKGFGVHISEATPETIRLSLVSN